MNKKTQFRNTGKDIRELVKQVLDAFPENNAFQIKENKVIKQITFLQMVDDIKNLGAELVSLGLEKQRVGIIGDNSYPWFNAFLSVVTSGGVAVPFDKGFTSLELSNCISRSDIKALFYDKGHEEMIREAISLSGKTDIQTFLMKGEGEVLSQMRKSGEPKVLAGCDIFTRSEIDENKEAVILFTSGTTSASKAVLLSHSNIMSNIHGMQDFEKFYSDDVNMAFLPFHHSFGLVGVLVFMASGACSVFCDGLKYVSKNLAEYKVTVFVGVPLIVENMYKKIMVKVAKDKKEGTIKFGLFLTKALRTIGIDLRRKVFKQIIDGLGGHLRLIISGAAPLSADAAKGLNDFGIATIQGYGLTETSPVLCAERPEDMALGSVGKPLPNVKIKLANQAADGVGEIIAQGPNVMLGYMDQKAETDEVIIDGWFYTGDLGKYDSKGNLYIVGRQKNVIVMKNGKNIFPEEIEGIIAGWPYTLENMIFTREKHNELVLWAKIVYKPEYLTEEGITEEELAQRIKADFIKMNSELPTYKAVNHFILTDAPMIKTTTQKVKRNPEIQYINEHQSEEKAYNCTE